MFNNGKKSIRTILALVLIIAYFANTTTAYASYSPQKIKNNCNRYYYEQLNELGKKIYDNFEKAKEKFWNNEEVIYPIGYYNGATKAEYYIEAATLARKAYLSDNPEANIWYKESEYYLHCSNTGVVTMNLSPKDSTGRYADIESEELPEAINEFEKIAQEFAETLEGTEEEMLTQIHDWLAKNATYDYTYEQLNTHNAYGAIVEGMSVCSGFAYAYKYIADLVGLDVLYVTGTACGTPHAWNLVKLDGEWRLVDITYNKSSYKPLFLFTEIDDGVHIPDDRFTYPTN